MKYSIGSYSIERLENGELKIDYKRSPKDFFYIIVYLIIALPILFFDYKLIRYLLTDKIDLNSIVGYCLSVLLLLFGVYFFTVSLETFLKPTKNTFFIDSVKKQLLVKLNLLKKQKLDFNEIKQFDLTAKNITISSYHEGITYKRPLFLVFMQIQLLNGKTLQAHKFEGTSLLLSNSEKEKNKSLKEVSKQISEIVSKECGKKLFWKGTQSD